MWGVFCCLFKFFDGFPISKYKCHYIISTVIIQSNNIKKSIQQTCREVILYSGCNNENNVFAERKPTELTKVFKHGFNPLSPT